jgi:FMN phosphatase YigB (HAD superfamily)
VAPGPEGSSSRLLLLDVNGVLFEDPFPALLRTLADASATDCTSLRVFYRRALRVDLWSGSISEPEFWRRLLAFASVPQDADGWRQRLLAAMAPLPALARLHDWADSATIWLSTNQRSEWLTPTLARHDVARFVERVLISDQLGVLKPDPAVLLSVRRAWTGPRDAVLIVDDQPEVLRVGDRAGYQVLLADAAQQWIAQVDSWTAGSGQRNEAAAAALPPCANRSDRREE